MVKKQQLDGLSYQQAQRRNSEKFRALSKNYQKQLRQQGYKNVGWANVRKSWELLKKSSDSKPVDFVKFAINKAELRYEEAKENDDLFEALEAGQALIESIKMKYQ